MFVLLAATVLLAGTPDSKHHDCRSYRTRLDRSRVCGSAFAAFEFAPANGAGMGTACAGTVPTGAKGETLTFARTGNATCLKSASLTSGIAPGDMVTLTGNQPRIMAGDATGVMGFLQEKQVVNNAIRNEEFDNAAWTSTATVTANQFTTPLNTAVGDQLSDVSGAALQGSCQTITTSSATQQAVSVYVRAGTASSAQITMTGTGSATGDCTGTVTGLASTWSRLTCGSAAAYAGTLTAVTVCINVGTVAGDTGTIGAWGFQHELNRATPTSLILTAGTAVTRNADSALSMATHPAALTGIFTAGSSAATLIPQWNTNEPSVGPYLVYIDTVGRPLYAPNSSSMRTFDGVNDVSRATTYTANTAIRFWSSWLASTISVNNGGGTTTGSFDGTMGSTTQLFIGGFTGTAEPDGILKLVCLDPDSTRCR